MTSKKRIGQSFPKTEDENGRQFEKNSIFAALKNLVK